MKATGAIYLVILLTLFFAGCSEPVELGERGDSKTRKVEIADILCDPPAFADDTVEIRGELKSAENLFLSKKGQELLLAPVGFRVPDSLIGGKAVCRGVVFYHEEMGDPGLAVNWLKVRPPKRRAGHP